MVVVVVVAFTSHPIPHVGYFAAMMLLLLLLLLLLGALCNAL